MRRLLVVALLAALPAVAFAKKAPWAELDGSFANPAHADEVDVFVAGVDGKRYVPVRVQQKIEPGPHFVYLVSARVAGGGLRSAKPWPMKAEPCTRYLLAAKHENLSADRYEILVVGTERIGECTLPKGYVAPAPAPASAAAPVVEPLPESPAPPPPHDPAPSPAPAPRPADETGATQY